MHKPQGHNSLSPYIIVGNAQALLDFLQAVFDAKPFFVHRDEVGEPNHVEIRIEDSVLMIGQMPGAVSQAHLHVYVPDVDATFAKAVAAGGAVAQEVMEKGDGDRRGGVADSTGTTWWFATQKEPRG